MGHRIGSGTAKTGKRPGFDPEKALPIAPIVTIVADVIRAPRPPVEPRHWLFRPKKP